MNNIKFFSVVVPHFPLAMWSLQLFEKCQCINSVAENLTTLLRASNKIWKYNLLLKKLLVKIAIGRERGGLRGISVVCFIFLKL